MLDAQDGFWLGFLFGYGLCIVMVVCLDLRAQVRAEEASDEGGSTGSKEERGEF